MDMLESIALPPVFAVVHVDESTLLALEPGEVDGTGWYFTQNASGQNLWFGPFVSQVVAQQLKDDYVALLDRLGRHMHEAREAVGRSTHNAIIEA